MIHFTQAIPPIIICVKLVSVIALKFKNEYHIDFQGLTNNDFETNLASMNLSEGIDYWLFS